jgi:putative DNA primase/helicase
VAGHKPDYCDKKSFLLNKHDGGANNDIARLRGARFVTASESEAGKRLAEALLKELTGNDMITARYLYGEYFDFRPTLKLWLSTNHRPKVGGTDEGIWRRIKLIPYTVTIPEEERDKHLGDKLKAEASGILNWCVAGGVRWTIRGLVEPSSVRSSTAEYRDEQDGIAHFIDEKLTRESNAEVRASELIEAYANHCAENGESRLPSRALSDGLIERGFTKRRVGARSSKPAGFYWSGICVRV